MSANGTNQVSVDCGQCKQRFSVTLPAVQVFNTSTASIAVATHEKPVRCPKCGVHYVLGAQFMANWGMVEISEEQAAKLKGSSIIVPQLGIH